MTGEDGDDEQMVRMAGEDGGDKQTGKDDGRQR